MPFSGYQDLDPVFAERLQRLIAASPHKIVPISGYRSVERQTQLWNDALKKYGSAEAARKWVAPPGNSRHNHRGAVDFGLANGQRFAGSEAAKWLRANAAAYGLSVPLSNEDWHVELAGSRSGGHNHSAATGAQTGGARSGGSRSWRNQNPGNLRYGNFAKQYGAIGQDKDGFAIFADEASGTRAQVGLLRSKNYAGLTLQQAINRYAPAADKNNPQQYASVVSQKTGIPLGATLSSLNDQQMSALAGAMRQHEGWIVGSGGSAQPQSQSNPYAGYAGPVPTAPGAQMASYTPIDIAGLLAAAQGAVAGQAPLPTSDALLAQLTAQRQAALATQLGGIDTGLQAALQGIAQGRVDAGNQLVTTANQQAPDFAALIGQYAQGSPVAPSIAGQGVYNNALAAFGGDPNAVGMAPYNQLALQQEAVGGGLLSQTAQGADTIIRDILTQALGGVEAAGTANANVAALKAQIAAQNQASSDLFNLSAQLGQQDLRAEQDRAARGLSDQLSVFNALFGAQDAGQGRQLQVDSFNADQAQRAFTNQLSTAQFGADQQQRAFTNDLSVNQFNQDAAKFKWQIDTDARDYATASANTKADQTYRDRQLSLQIAQVGQAERDRQLAAVGAAADAEAKAKAAATKQYQDNLKSPFSQTLIKAGVDPAQFWTLDQQGQSKILETLIKSGKLQQADASGARLTNDQVLRSAGLEQTASAINTQFGVISSSGKYDGQKFSFEQKYDGNNTEELLAFAGIRRSSGAESTADTTKLLRKMAKTTPELKKIPKDKRAAETAKWMKRQEDKVKVYAGEGYLDANGKFIAFTAEEKATVKDRTK